MVVRDLERESVSLAIALCLWLMAASNHDSPLEFCNGRVLGQS